MFQPLIWNIYKYNPVNTTVMKTRGTVSILKTCSRTTSCADVRVPKDDGKERCFLSLSSIWTKEPHSWSSADKPAEEPQLHPPLVSRDDQLSCFESQSYYLRPVIWWEMKHLPQQTALKMIWWYTHIHTADESPSHKTPANCKSFKYSRIVKISDLTSMFVCWQSSSSLPVCVCYHHQLLIRKCVCRVVHVLLLC